MIEIYLVTVVTVVWVVVVWVVWFLCGGSGGSWAVVWAISISTLWLSLVDTIVQTSVPFLVVFQSLWTSNTSNSLSMPASNVLMWVMWVSNVSIEVRSTVGTFVRAVEGGGWVPWFGCNTFV